MILFIFLDQNSLVITEESTHMRAQRRAHIGEHTYEEHTYESTQMKAHGGEHT